MRAASAKTPQIRMPWDKDQEEETRTADVVRVLYESHETSFRLLLVTRQGAEEKWVGTIPKVQEGQSVRATGKVEPDKRRPSELVFRVSVAAPSMPDTTEGMVSYLGSGAIAGIGPSLAKRIVDHFGADTLTILDEAPHRLTEVRGIGAEKHAKIVASWAEERAVGAIMIFLHANGATAALAARIFARYGSRAIEIIKENPYQLALDVPAIGFKTADKIAQSAGMTKDSPARTMAGILQVLHDAESGGHLYCEETALLRDAKTMLGLDVGLIKTGLQGLIDRALVVTESIPGGWDKAIYRATVADVELYVAGRISGLVGASPAVKKGSLNPKKAIAEFEAAKKVTLAPGQVKAVELAARSKLLVITGGPGTGKTTLTRAIIAMLRAGERMVRLCAPTGRAAKRLSDATGMPAGTIHRLLGFDREKGGFLHCHANPLPDCDVLIVDESSMVDILLAAALLDALPSHAHLIVIGDRDQLPSVGPGAFLADLIASEEVATVRLSQIFRQAEGSPIIDAAHRINAGEMPEKSAFTHDGGFFFVAEKVASEAAAKALHLVLDRIPAKFGLDPRTQVQVLTPMHKGETGTIALNEKLQAILNPDGAPLNRKGKVFRVGDRVTQTRNNYDLEVYNGDIGVVSRLGDDGSDVLLYVCFEDGREIPYEGADLSDLTLAYCISAHRSQGSGFPVVIVVMLTAHYALLSRNLLYTAVTRGKRLVCLVTQKRALKVALSETRKAERHTALSHRLAAALS